MLRRGSARAASAGTATATRTTTITTTTSTTTTTHGHHHHHDHDHGRRARDSRGILGVGIAAGLLPCPSALVVLLSAIALHRIGFGFALIAAFSLGLAATITGIGLVAVLARRAFGRVSLEGRVVRALPAAQRARDPRRRHRDDRQGPPGVI